MGKTKDYKECRTCLNCTKGLQLLNKKAPRENMKTERKSYAELLKDVARINIKLDINKKLPQRICRACVEKLISAYEFVQQANEVNRQLWNRFNAEEACLQESQIEYPLIMTENAMEIRSQPDPSSVDKWSADFKDTKVEHEEDDLPLCEIKLKIEENAEITKDENSEYKENNSVNSTKISSVLAKTEETRSLVRNKSDAESKDLEESNQDFVCDSINNEDMSDEQETDEDDDIDNLNLPIRQRNKIKRMKGQQYLGFTKADKMKQTTPKSQRQVGPMCSSSFCARSSLRHCQKFDDETRKSLFKMFWNMNWEAKREFAKKLVDQVDTKKKTVENSKKRNSFIFKLPYKEETLQVCQSMFLSTLSLNIGMVKGWVTNDKPSRVSDEDKLFKCEFCDKVCSRNSALIYHRRIHTGEKPFLCNLCGQGFRIKHLLRVHVLSAHSSERPYKCNECDKSFKSLKNFTVHKRVHTGEKPYMCDSCGGKYRYTGSLNFHRLTCDPTKNNPKNNITLDENNLKWYHASKW